MAYRFDVEHLTAGRSRFTCGAYTADSEHALARNLVEAGMPDGHVWAGRAGRTDWTARSLHALAAATLGETDNGFDRGIYAIHPRATIQTMHPALERAVFALRERRRMAFEARAGRGVAPPTPKAPGGA